MPELAPNPGQNISDRIRVRVNGLLVLDHALLMVRLMSPVKKKLIWIPPGGGLTFGESLVAAVKREVIEETGIQVDPGSLWYINEVCSEKIHAIEFYYQCCKTGGQLKKGTDPEHDVQNQIIREVAFLPFDDLNRPDIYPDYLRTGFAEDYMTESPGLPKLI